MNKLAQLTGTVWDMDGCVYEYTQGFVDGCQKAAVDAVRAFIPSLADVEYSVLHDRAWNSYLKHGSSITCFANEYGLDHDEVNAVYHSYLNPNHISPLRNLPLAFKRAVKGGHKVCLATHSHMNFASRMIGHLKLHNSFNMHANMLTLEQFGVHHMKDKTAQMVTEAAKVMGENVRNIALVEDTARNLIPAKDAGATTILVHWGKVPDKKPTHVDYMFRTPVEVLKFVRRA